MITVDEMITRLATISNKSNDEDKELISAVSLKLSSLQASLRKEVERTEKLQHFANTVLEAANKLK